MLERGLVSRILFPAPPPSYDVDCFPHDLIWVPKSKTDVVRPEDPAACPPIEDCVPCLLLTYPSARFLIIFFHSNAEDLGRCHGFCCYIRDQFQVHVLAVEYPGYGICPGVPCGETVMENALAAMKFVTDTLQWPMDSIKVFGRSIGTGPAIGLASAFSLAGLILVTPFLSVQELFRDRVGPFASFVEEWFPNSDSAPKITSPTMIIHGQRDELISCRHGESIYELLRPRKLLISPPEMEHNTNLLTNLQFFVLPMFQFFALPDYAFQDLQVPAWAYDKRRSPFYIRPSVEVSSHQLPNSAGKKRMHIPTGDDGTTPATVDNHQPEASATAKLKKGSEKALKGEAPALAKRVEGRELAPMFSSKDRRKRTEAQAPSSQPTPSTGPLLISLLPPSQTVEAVDESAVPEEKSLSTTKGQSLFQRERGGVSHGARAPDPPPPRTESAASRSGARGSPHSPDHCEDNGSPSRFSPAAREVFKRLEDNGKICAREICSDELCVLEERMDADTEQNMRRQEKALGDLMQARQVQHGGADPKDGMPVAPRLLAKSLRVFPGGTSCGPQAMWPSWCGKQPQPLNVVEEEVHMQMGHAAPPPGLPPSDIEEADMPRTSGAVASSGALPTASSHSGWTFGDDDPGAWEGWATSPVPSPALSRGPGCVQVVLPGDGPGKNSHSELVTRSNSKGISTTPSKHRGPGNESFVRNPLLSACCRALPSDPLLDRVSPLPRPRASSNNDDDPIVPLGRRVITGSHQPMSPEEENLWRKYPLGTVAPPRRPPAVVDDKLPAPYITSGFQRGTKFAI